MATKIPTISNLGVVGVPQGPGEGTAVGWSPEGEALYVCTRCESLHRKYEDCPRSDHDV